MKLLDLTPKVQFIKNKLINLISGKQKVCSANDPSKNMKRQDTERQKLFANKTFTLVNKRLISRLYKVLSKVSKQNNLIRRWLQTSRENSLNRLNN